MIELTLHHDGGHWVARGDRIRAAAPTLDRLDAEVRRLLVEGGRLEPGEEVQVRMAFDNATIPEWIRQYAQHYFNRIVAISG